MQKLWFNQKKKLKSQAGEHTFVQNAKKPTSLENNIKNDRSFLLYVYVIREVIV